MSLVNGFRITRSAIAVAVVVAAAPLSAQEQDTRRDVVARIVDGTSRTPLNGAAVEVIDRDRYYMTDENGQVTIPNVRGAQVRLRISLIGYEGVEATIAVGEGVGVQTIELEPRAVVLEEIQVHSNRLRARRNSVATSVRAFDRERLLSSAAWDVAQFLRTHAMIRETPCPGGLQPYDCAYVRGRAQPVTVYIDEMPVFGGLQFLDLYPTEEMYLVEVYGGGRHIRLYTNHFMERVAEGRAFIRPVIW